MPTGSAVSARTVVDTFEFIFEIGEPVGCPKTVEFPSPLWPGSEKETTLEVFNVSDVEQLVELKVPDGKAVDGVTLSFDPGPVLDMPVSPDPVVVKATLKIAGNAPSSSGFSHTLPVECARLP